MSSQEIRLIKTGEGFAGARVGLLFAPKDAAAGSMVALTDFLNQHPNIRAMPGYHGPNENHVLRMSGIPDDAALMQMLTQEFPRWQQQQGIAPASQTRIADDAKCEPLEEVEHFPHQSAFKRMLKENSSTLTGLAYMAGSMGLMLAAWQSPKRMPNKPPHDYFRTYTAGAYFVASALLVALSQKSDNPRNVYQILEEIYPSLDSLPEADKQELQEQTSSVARFVRNHPWEISMILNATGAASHALSCLKRGAKAEMIGATASLTGCLFSAIVPEKGGRSLLNLDGFVQDADGRTLLDKLDDFADNHPNTAGWMKNVRHTYDWLAENPLKVAATVQVTGNAGYLAAGLRQRNYPLVGMSTAFASGNYIQSLATKGRGDGFDSVVSATAQLIAADPALAQADTQSVYDKINRLCDKLSEQREIVHNKRRMVQGVVNRLERTNMGKQLEAADTLTGFIPSEKHILMQSPFARPRHVDRLLADETTSQSAAIS